MQIYTGKAADSKPEKNQGMRAVLDMISGLQRHTITCDNFFTSHTLGEELLQRKMTMIGAVRSNKPLSFCPRKNKNVLLMSTSLRDAAISSKDHKKPQIILDYN